MKRLYILLTLALSSLYLQAQTSLDSLYAVWEDEAQADSTRAMAYNAYIADGFLYSFPDSAYQLASELMKFGKENAYPRAEALAYNLQGLSLAVTSNYPQALKYYDKSLKIHEELGYKRGIANVLNNIGIIYEKQSNYPEAISFFQRSLAIRKETGNKTGVASSLNNIGVIYRSQGNYSKALHYYQQSLQVYQGVKNKEGIANTLNNIGHIYHNQRQYSQALDYYQQSLKIDERLRNYEDASNSLNNIGLVYKDQVQYSKAMDYFQRSLKLSQGIRNKEKAALSLSNIGGIYKDQGKYPEALEHLRQSLENYEAIGDKHGAARMLIEMGGIYSIQGKHQEATEKCEKARDYLQSIGSFALQMDACQCLYQEAKWSNNSEKALAYLEQMIFIRFSLQEKDIARRLQQMEFEKQMYRDSIAAAEATRLVQEAHEAEIRKKNSLRNIFMVGGLFLLIIAGGLYSRNRYIKKSRDIISKEKDRSENLLLNILPAEIAEELKAKGSAVAREFEQVSILFTDFKGFTQMSEALSAAELVEELNFCFKAFDAICGIYKIEKIKTIGDSYMAAGGLPVPHPDAVRNTTLAALEMTAFILSRKAEREAEGKIGFAMRAGVHTGNVVAGIVGVKKFQYDVWGDTVNTASRMESSGAVGKVNISQFTYEILKDDPQFTFQYRGKVEAKGKGEVEMWFVEMSSKQ